MRDHVECLDRTVFSAGQYLETTKSLETWSFHISKSDIKNYYKSIKNFSLHYWSITQCTWQNASLEWAFQTLKVEELHFTTLHTAGALFQKPCLQL